MIHFEEIPSTDRVLLHSYFCSIQYFLVRISAVSSAAPLRLDLMNFKSYIDSLVYLSDEVPF